MNKLYPALTQARPASQHFTPPSHSTVATSFAIETLSLTNKIRRATIPMQGWCRPFWGLLPWAVRGIGKRTVRKGGSFFALSRPHLMPYFAGSLCAAKGTKPPPPRPSFPPGFTIRKKSTRLCQLLVIGGPSIYQPSRRSCQTPHQHFRHPRPTQQNLCHFVAFAGEK